MSATIQKILKPSKYRAVDTSMSEQIVGEQLLEDPSFDVDVGQGSVGSHWETNNTNLEITGGKAVWTEYSGTGNRELKDKSTGPFLPVTDRYRVTIVVSDYTSGELSFNSGSYNTGYVINSAGTFTFDFSPEIGSGNFHLKASNNDGDGTEDAVLSVSEVSVYKLESFGNNNHGQIYSGRGLEFDGVSDTLSVPNGVTHNQDWRSGTIATYLYLESTPSTSDRIFSHFSGSHTRLYFALQNNGKLRHQLGDEDDFTDGNIALENKTWYRVVLTWNIDGTVNTYINGVLDKASTGIELNTSNTIMGSLSVNGVRIGGHSSTLNLFDGKMSDFQMWNSTWTQSDATFDYLNPESLVLNNSGTSLTESNLKLWYPMQDGHRGQQSYIMDGANTGVGPDLLSEGQFNSDSGFRAVGTGWSISNGVASCDGTQSFSTDIQLEDNVNFVSPDENGPWKINFTLSNYSAGILTVGMGGYNFSSSITANGDYSILTTPTNTSSNNRLYLRGNADFIGSLSNITVHKVNDKHHATTVFMGDNLYTANNALKVASDGTTADETDATTGWNDLGTSTFTTSSTSHSGSKSIVYEANVNHGGISTDLQPYLTVGRTYKLSLFVRHTTGGTSASDQSLRFSDASNLQSNTTEIAQVEPSDTTFTEVSTEFVYDDDKYRYFGAKELNGDGSSGDGGLFMDTMYIKEVGVASGWTDADQQLDIAQTALQSYNQLAWFSGGSTSHVQLSGDITKNPHNSNVSFSFNVMRNITTDQHMVICDEDTTSLRKIRFTEDGKILIEGNTNDDNVQATLLVNDKNWHHYVVTCNSGVVKFYQDGELLTNINADTIDDAITLRRIGKGTSKGMEGCITECAIWDVTLSQLEVNELYNDGKTLDARLHSENTNLAHYWKNNGLAIWTDLAGDKDGTPTNIEETILLPSGVDSSRDTQGFLMNRQKNTNSLNLYHDGTTAIGKGPRIFTSSAPIETYTACSFSCWVKMQNKNALSTIFSIGTSDTNHIHVAVEGNDDGKILWTYDLNQTNQRYETANAAINALDTWFHVVCVCDNSQSNDYDKLKVYVNGSISANSTDATLNTGTVQSITPDESQFEIGSNPHSARKLTGQIDDFLIYNDILTTTEITRIYNAGKRSHR